MLAFFSGHGSPHIWSWLPSDTVTVEARKLEHHYPHALKVKYKVS